MFQRFIYFATALMCGLAASAASPENAGSDPYHLKDSLPERWTYTPQQTQEIPSSDDGWWRTFGDATLDSLVDLAVANNYNLAITLHRTQMARNTMMQARGGWMPTVGLSAGWTKERQSGAMTSPTMPATVSSGFNAGLSAQWEIDIFGKIASGVKAKKGAYNASRAEYAGAMVSLCAQVATTYLQLRTLQAQLAVAEIHLESQKKTVNIARTRFETSLASKLDVAQAEETYYNTLASIPKMQYSIHAAINAIETLTGTLSDRLRGTLTTPTPLPDCRRMISAGIPADLLRRRPDIAQAEFELAEYAAEIGVAKKDFLPTLTLEGTVGTAAHDIKNLFTNRSFTYSIAPTLSWTIFDGLSRKYTLANAREQMQAGIDNYNYVVATAFEETDNAIAGYHFSIIYLDNLDKVLEANSEALELAIDRYKNSLSPMLDVVTAQINALAAEQEKISAQGQALASLVNLYEALGGGFDISSI